jgi:hypothetical protein
MYNAVSGLRTNQNLIKEVLNKLLLQRSRGEKTVEIRTKEFGNEVTDKILDDDCEKELATNISSRGDMKMSHKLITWVCVRDHFYATRQVCPHFHVSDA